MNQFATICLLNNNTIIEALRIKGVLGTSDLFPNADNLDTVLFGLKWN